MAETTNLKRRTHGSKNKKKGWRKTDIKDVEEHLEDERLQLRTGGVVAEKTDEQLFFVEKDIEEKSVEPRRKKRIRTGTYFKHLELDPNIKPAPKPPPKKPRKKSKRVLEILEKEKDGIYTRSKRRKLDHAAALKKKKEDEKQFLNENKMYDIWAKDDLLVAKEVNKETNVEANEHYLKVTKKVRKKLPTGYGVKPSARPAVEPPLPGVSYNPTYDDHQDLLRKANKVEVSKLDRERELNKQTKVPKVSETEMKETWLEEMSAGLFDHDDNEHKPEETQDELRPPNPPVRRDGKKTLKQRRKEKMRKMEDKKSVKEKVEKKRIKEVYRLKTLKSEISQKQQEIDKKTRQRWEKRNDPNRVKTLGPHKYEDASIDLKLSDELTGNLRTLKAEGSLLVDRYKSLQKRNIIEPRIAVKHKRKYKLKVTEKRSHREFK
ncbi:ribosome biogenesis protein NOP53-like [Glandiceps talaboti]